MSNLQPGVKLFLLICIMSFWVQLSYSQTIESVTINSTGKSVTNNEIIYEWSVGELAMVETMMGNDVGITNGSLQPLIPIFIITGISFPISANNILTANGDGSNDAWVIKDLERYPENELTVFDRGGRTVYQTKNYKNDWKGDLSGLPLAEDTYFYILKLFKDGKTGIKKGFITILN